MASKQITFNLYRYFLAKYKDVSVIHKIVDIEPSLDELFNIWHHRFKYKLKSDGNNLVRTNELITSSDEEIANRCEYVKDLNGPYVIKHFPMDNDITPFLINQVDRVYTLSRKDIFGNALSICLSRISKSWIRSQYQQKVISEMVQTPVIIPVNEFRRVVQQISDYNRTYLADAIRILEFDDICSVTNSFDFCRLLDLEYIEFSFIKVGEEFGNNKTRMILNMPELRDICLDMRA